MKLSHSLKLQTFLEASVTSFIIFFTTYMCEGILNSFLSVVPVSIVNSSSCLLKLLMRGGSDTNVDYQSIRSI